MKKTKQSTLIALLAASLALPAFAQTTPTYKMTTAIPPDITTPDTVETSIGTLKFFDGYPDDATTQKVYDNLDLINGVNAFLNAMPGASVEALKVGFASQGAEILGQLAAIGIEKGKTFAPDARMKKILTEAVAVGNAWS